jgi:hypothetical protein
MSDEPPLHLQGLLYMLYYVADPKSYQGLNDSDRADLERKHSAQEINAFHDALTWAAEHPDFAFSTLSPLGDHMTHDNATILHYFTKLREGMKPIVDKLRTPAKMP